MVMPANHSSPIIHYWAGAYPGKIGWLVGPSAASKTKLRRWMPYALDNDAFSAWTKKITWDEQAWRDLLEWAKASGSAPRWVLVPDVVADREATIAKWHHYEQEVRKFGWPLAFAVQDGMTAKDVPSTADVIFVGGSTEWKWSTVHEWAKFPRVHVGRVNSIPKVRLCEGLKIESVDGTGWPRDDSRRDKMAALDMWMRGEQQPSPNWDVDFT